MSGRKFAAILVVSVGCCTTAIACGGDSTALTAPAPADSASAHRAQLLATGRGATALGCFTRLAANDMGVFGPSGGTFVFGTSRLIIPPGALRDTVTISATIPDGDASQVQFRPQGLQFAKSAGLLLDTSGCSTVDTIAPSVVYLSESGTILETIPAVYDPRWHTIAAPIDHFSGYAIAF